MIITLKQINIHRFLEISVIEAPNRIFLELVTAINKTGIITGKARMSMRCDPLSVFATMEAIKVKHAAIPIAPTKRLTKKRERFSIGKPKKRLNANVNKPIKISSYIP